MKIMIELLVALMETSAQCPYRCTCPSKREIQCIGLGFWQPPAGHWPDTDKLKISSNAITALNAYSFSRYPKLRLLTMDDNPLTELDLVVFDGLNKLYSVRASNCAIITVVPLSREKVLPSLTYLFLYGNKIKSLPDNLLSNLPNIQTLKLFNNPLTLPGDHCMMSNTLVDLNLDGINASGITSKTFGKLPLIRDLRLCNSNIGDIQDIFTQLPKLMSLFMHNNPLQVIRKGSFSPTQRIHQLSVSDSQLEILELEAVDGIVMDSLWIDNTPLACKCHHQHLYDWAQKKGIYLWARCGENPSCPFAKK